MAQSSSMTESKPLHFTKPLCFQQFDGFAGLPYDLRYLIWKDAIDTPGIHFLRLVENSNYELARNTPAPYSSTSVGAAIVGSPRAMLGGGSSSVERTMPDAEDATRSTLSTARPPLFSAFLRPTVDLACADHSYYIAKNKTLARLWESCNEARYVVDKAHAQPGNLTLNGGQLVMLEPSSDVVCIDYPDMTHCHRLGRWASHLDLDQLAKVRRLAVRYQHEWDNGLLCDECGRMMECPWWHSYPRHIYQFAALFKNLEAFYFIDYMTLRRRPIQTSDFNKPGKWLSGKSGRTYFEADLGSCLSHTCASKTLSWVRDKYINFCSEESMGPSHPENVSFGVIGCEWDSNQESSPARHSAPGSRPMTKKRPRNRTTTSAFPVRLLHACSYRPCQPTDRGRLPFVFGDNGKWDFTFNLAESLGGKTP